MTALAFWENPIVVSALRLKYRRGNPLRSVSLYLMLLATGGAVLKYYNAVIGGSWARNFFLGIMGVQFVISLLIAVTATSASVRSEVANRTLDFQRLTGLSPRQILLGKLLGEPAMAFFLGMGTVPLSVLCWLGGGVAFEVMVLMYVNLVTNTFMFGALGLLQRLDLPAGKPGGSGTGGGQWVVFFFVIALVNIVPILIAAGGSILAVPWAAALVGLPTPLPAFYGLAINDPWRYGLSLFDVEIPFLVVTPLAQLGIVWLCFQSMVRQLVSPLNPVLSKRSGYLAVIVVDVIAAGVLYDSSPWALPLGPRCAAFCLVHLAVSLWAIASLTAWRETVHSWVWRLRGRVSPLADWWLGDRSTNGLAVLTFCAIGLTTLFLLVWLPGIRQPGAAPAAEAAPGALAAAVLTVVLTLAFGTLYQWFLLLAGRGGIGLMMIVVTFPLVVPHLVGEYYRLDWVRALSPSAHFGQWLFDSSPSLELIPVLLIYGAVAVVVALALRRHLQVLAQTVDRKLRQMGVAGAGQ